MNAFALTLRALLLALFLFASVGGDAFCADHDHGHAEETTQQVLTDCACLCHAPSVPQTLFSSPQAVKSVLRVFLPTDQTAHDDDFRSRIFQPPRPPLS